MIETVLDKPVVKDLIEALKSFDPSSPLRIEDADTGWEIHKIHINFREGKIWLCGEYHEMNFRS